MSLRACSGTAGLSGSLVIFASVTRHMLPSSCTPRAGSRDSDTGCVSEAKAVLLVHSDSSSPEPDDDGAYN